MKPSTPKVYSCGQIIKLSQPEKYSYFLCKSTFIETSILIKAIIKRVKMHALTRTLYLQQVWSFIKYDTNVILQVSTTFELFSGYTTLLLDESAYQKPPERVWVCVCVKGGGGGGAIIIVHARSLDD